MFISMKQLTLSIFLVCREMFVQPQEIINKYIGIVCVHTRPAKSERKSVCVCAHARCAVGEESHWVQSQWRVGTMR